jgi:aspartate aminotransferase-like enzyme
MESDSPLVFKVATEDWEMDQIHQLNYKTFVEEIPQHAPPPNGRLVDRFHAENMYLICLSGRKLAGMMALRARRPFSLDQKLENLDSHLPPGRALCELRLLAVDKKYRTGQVFQGFMAMVWQQFVEHGWDMALISGTTRQRKLYHHLGFIPFGPLVGKDGAQFQPMYMSIEWFETAARDFLSSRGQRAVRRAMVNLLPGPVAVSRAVSRAFEEAPESHRSEAFVADFRDTKEALSGLTGARHVEVLLGSGTLANDAVAAQLSLEQGPGLVVASGEFGERLVDHARRFGLAFVVMESPRGRAPDFGAIAQVLSEKRRAWLWIVHCETSTGVQHDLGRLKELCAARGVKLCLDCISSIGTVPVNLEEVHFATCSSGKGLQSFPGLGLVFYNHEIQPAPGKLPRYLDLGLYASQEGVAFTLSSNLVAALRTSVKRTNWAGKFAELRDVSAWLRPALRELGLELIGADADASPAVMTIALPEQLGSAVIAGQLQEAGFLVSYNSDYLRRENWLQICLMGEFQREKLVSLLNHLNRICFRKKPGGAARRQAVASEQKR